MELPVIEMDTNEARKQFVAYRDSIRKAQEQKFDEAHQRRVERMALEDREMRTELERNDEALKRAYRQLSLGKRVISLTETMLAAGLNEAGYPRLGISRADQTEVECRVDGQEATFEPAYRAYAGRYAVSKRFTVRGFPEWVDGRGRSWRSGMVATVPPVPAPLRPADDLSNYSILFEASWRNPQGRRAVGDPALLKHLGADLYAVLAVWDLTPLERAVLGIAATG